MLNVCGFGKAVDSCLLAKFVIGPWQVEKCAPNFRRCFGILGPTGGSDGEESACNEGDTSSIPGSGRSPGGGHGNPLQYSCLENPMDRGVWQATVHWVSKSRTQLNGFHFQPSGIFIMFHENISLQQIGNA